MRTIVKTAGFAALAAVTLAAVPGLADGHLEKAIKARKAQMVLYSWNLGTLGAMAKGAADYDAAAAEMAAKNLVALSAMNSAAMWPQGSDSTAMPGKTRAKVEAWTTWPEIAEKTKAMDAAVGALAAVAGKGLTELQGAIGDVGKSCGACHKPYREEK